MRTVEDIRGSDRDDKAHLENLIVLDEGLDVDQRLEVSNMLMDDQWREVFSSNAKEIGRLTVGSHRIELLDETPIYQKPRRFPERVEIEKQCQELHLMDVIEPSNSSWSSPVVPIRKKDSQI